MLVVFRLLFSSRFDSLNYSMYIGVRNFILTSKSTLVQKVRGVNAIKQNNIQSMQTLSSHRNAKFSTPASRSTSEVNVLH